MNELQDHAIPGCDDILVVAPWDAARPPEGAHLFDSFQAIRLEATGIDVVPPGDMPGY